MSVRTPWMVCLLKKSNLQIRICIALQKKDSVLGYEKKIVSYVNTSNQTTITGAATQKNHIVNPFLYNQFNDFLDVELFSDDNKATSKSL